MEAQLNEANTFPSQSYSQSFFSRLPTDNRFLQSSYIKIPPSASIDSNTLTFILEKFEAANVYMIQNACLNIRFKITTAAGNLPTTANAVAPRNNVLNTLWESCRIFINDVLLTTNARDYHYKSYICTAISYSLGSKASHLQGAGWYSDTSGMFNDVTTNNTGFEERNKLFRIDNDTTKGYEPSGAEFYGRIFHDLIACETGLPPHTKVKIELDRAPDAFVLQCASTDTEKYKIKILSADLYVPVAQLSISVYNELSTYMARTADGTFRNDVAIHYRRLEIRPVAIPNGNRDYYTKSLLSDSDNPCKIVLCFVESKAKAGSYHSNPFEFRRTWEYTESLTSEENGTYSLDGNSLSEKMVEIENRLQTNLSVQLQSHLSQQTIQFNDLTALTSKLLESQKELLDCVNKQSQELASLRSLGEGQPSTSKAYQIHEQAQNVESAAESRKANERLESFIASNEVVEPNEDVNLPNRANEGTSNLQDNSNLKSLRSRQVPFRPSSTTSSSRPPSRSSEYFSTSLRDQPFVPIVPAAPAAPVKKTQYIQSIQCTLNSTPIDQVFINNQQFLLSYK